MLHRPPRPRRLSSVRRPLQVDQGTTDEVETFTIVTTKPNDLTKTIHNRMPVILDRGDYDGWMDRSGGVDLLKSYPADEMKAYEVSTRVNSVRNDDPECLAPQ